MVPKTFRTRARGNDMTSPALRTTVVALGLVTAGAANALGRQGEERTAGALTPRE